MICQIGIAHWIIDLRQFFQMLFVYFIDFTLFLNMVFLGDEKMVTAIVETV